MNKLEENSNSLSCLVVTDHTVAEVWLMSVLDVGRVLKVLWRDHFENLKVNL